MNKFQPIDFQDLDDLYAFLPEDQLKMVKALRALVYECIPEIEEKLSYNVPFFRLKKTICYIWPGAVPWGKTTEGVAIGFYQGHRLHDPEDYLEAGKKKVIRNKTFDAIEEIDFDQLREFLFQAELLDKA
jgi:hypothetical protein